MSKEDGICYVICPNPSFDIRAMINGFAPKKPSRIKSEKHYPGGKGLHVAMALTELGTPCKLIGIWAIQNGQQIKNACLHYYPNLSISGPNVDGWNRSCYSFKSNNEWDDTELLGPGPEVDFNIADKIIIQITKEAAFINSVSICGSWPKGASEYSTFKIVEFCKAFGIPTFIDTTGNQLKHAIELKPSMIHLNRQEICDLFNLEFESALLKINEHCEIAAITDGKNGLFLMNKKESYHAQVHLHEEIISTIGSGDCLLAGLVSADYQDYPPQKASILGVACGAANCIRSELGMIYRKDVDRLISSAISEPYN